ncbi:8-amino-7-oxononanoate synthase [Chitinophaga caseinilytica]|uniref:8-amino-7-oxononanoate synthase n=1 Tax=Chitinophaga caseinilytica TaxID=2267521 RepID=A0ABZ2Z043_9BACT
MQHEDFLRTALDKRREQHAFRQLRTSGQLVDFCSNDYLGLARSERVQEAAHQISRQLPQVHGSGGSRLLAGNYELVEEAEKLIATFHDAPTGLIFNSGYDANLGFFASVPQKGDVIIYDQLIHASIRDGMRLSAAQTFSFLHNDLNDLEKKLANADGRVFVAVESVYSMDGDIAPLVEIAALCGRHHALLVVDEAHATGVVGEKGEGLVQTLGLQNRCFARIHTFGKAVGCHGAIVLGSPILRDYLINFCRAFIYTTALPPQAVAVILAAYDIFPDLNEERQHLMGLIRLFKSRLGGASETPIQVVMAPGNEQARGLAQHLQGKGMDVRAILHPTVPKGQERLRVVLHSFNTPEEVENLAATVLSYS